jgi:single-stranded DNA-binding protein
VRTRNYDSKEGVSKIAVEIHAEEVSFLGAAKKKPVVVEAASETLQ